MEELLQAQPPEAPVDAMIEMAKVHLATCYLHTGERSKARTMLEQSVPALKAKFGDGHDTTGAAKNALAHVYSSESRWADALPLAQEAVQQMRTSPSNSRSLKAAVMTLAWIYTSTKQYADAIPLLEEILAGVDLATSRDGNLQSYAALLADCYAKVKREPDALKLYEQMLPAWQKNIGTTHASTLNMLANLAQFHEKMGYPARAEPYYAQLVEARRPKSGTADTAYASALASLGLNLLKQDKYADAATRLRESLAAREKLAPDDWSTFNTRSMLGGALAGQKKYADAEPLLVQGYEGMKQRADKMPQQAKDLRLREALARLVQLYVAWGKPDEAAKWRKELEAVEKSAEKSKSP